MYCKKYSISILISMVLLLSSCSSEEMHLVDQWKENLESSENTESVNFISTIFNDQTYNDLLTIFKMSEEIAKSISRDKGVTQQTVAQILETGGYSAESAIKIARNLVDDIATVTGVKQSDIAKFLLEEEMSSSVDGILEVSNDAIEKVKNSLDKFGVEQTEELLKNIKNAVDDNDQHVTQQYVVEETIDKNNKVD